MNADSALCFADEPRNKIGSFRRQFSVLVVRMEIAYELGDFPYFIRIGHITFTVINIKIPVRQNAAVDNGLFCFLRDLERRIVNVVIEINIGIDIAGLYRNRRGKIVERSVRRGVIWICDSIYISSCAAVVTVIRQYIN